MKQKVRRPLAESRSREKSKRVMLKDVVELQVKRIGFEAENVNSYELGAPGGDDLMPFTAGSHIDLHLSNGLIRSYSLVNDQGERHRYVIAVNNSAASRGGSHFMHSEVRAGDTLVVSRPRNNFPLNEDADHSVLIAGGIGITPLLSMGRRLETLGRSWELFYAARTRSSAAFLGDLAALRSNTRLNINVDFDDERSGRVFDLPAIVRRTPAHAHLYCCGPLPMLEAFEMAAEHRPANTVHVEYFQGKEPPAVAGGFEIELARSKRTIFVQAGQTILDALRDAGIAVNFSCAEGVCGTCETRVLEGVPEHRDQFMSPAERAANKTVMICCSGSLSKTLVLDL
jgi:tetrachlorobenzoquinone reductase